MDRLSNLLGAAALGVADDAERAARAAGGLSASGTTALLALAEFLGGAPVGRVADVLGLTHSGAVRLVALLEREGLVERRAGTQDRRQVEVQLTATGRERAAAARAAREAVLAETVAGLDEDERVQLEALLGAVVEARVRARVADRRAGGEGGAWWCRTCDFGACGRPEGRCPAQQAAAAAAPAQ
ncbi:winged helix-turn-helix transcriptional regulator [Nocardioides anomalus]|uniref:Winged helix-turn-helix transcriptional regulator n=1 Tax=Nocardioides anomalus TaxID=2712223 RepID=A0A6G6WDZ1_9ACTN|nr:MarR family winged helix-turn-helix transcriptional regulator [Nocardioides anomalus]QIG43462.1 winged helix-turn-helix transcriptional regulator [Nocardioides anomalus]